MLQQKIISFTTYYISHYNTTWHHRFWCHYGDYMHSIYYLFQLQYYCYSNNLLLLLHITCIPTTQPDTIISIFYKYPCSHMLIQYWLMHWLKGADVMHYFNDKWIVLNWVFNFLLTCIRHDDIVHKVDAAGFRIFVSPNFYVSHYGFLTTAQTFYNCPYITNTTTHLCTIVSNTENSCTCS
jgi:hypothetical protein